jgi:hypothetical protein
MEAQMFSFFKNDPVKQQTKAYHSKLKQAMEAQRNGDIRSYSLITAEAEKLKQEIDQLQIRK